MEEKYFKYWQEKLGLTDWTIKFQSNVEPEDMALDEACGCTSYIEVGKTALIQILNPERYRYTVEPFDIERTIVHELLHLKLCLLEGDDDPVRTRVHHQLVDELAKSFVKARRDNEIKEDTDNDADDD